MDLAKYLGRRVKTAVSIIALVIFSSHQYATAQQNNTLAEKSARGIHQMIAAAKELYNNKLYNSALNEFDDIVRLLDTDDDASHRVVAEMEGYRTLCLIMVKSPNAHNAAQEYEKRFPHSHLCNSIRYSRALSHFDNGEYVQAGRLFDAVDKRSLAKEERSGYNFRRAYCKMRSGNTASAINIFNGVISEGNTPYLIPSHYYCGYLLYAVEEFGKAIPHFEKAMNDTRFNLLCKSHLLECRFMLKDYDYVVSQGPALYQETDQTSRPRIARIISEAYYALDQTEKARYYFELYSLSGTNLSRSDNFYAGMIAYTLNNHLAATDAFSKVAGTKDSIGQNAAYHLGQSYIQLKNKVAAQKAFKLASESNFDPTIKEDALFNYAKLSFDLNRNMGPIGQYLRLYPHTDAKWDEIHSYIATEFIMNGNYADAINALKNMRNHTSASRQILQKASFLRAMQLVRSGSFGNAIPYLEQATVIPTGNHDLKNLCQYWLAECHYRRDNFDKSMEILDQLQKSSRFRESNEFPTSIYNMGYNLFKKGEFAQALEIFNRYLASESQDREYEYEASLRIADCMFMERNYSQAAELYERLAAGSGYADMYAPLQAAISYGLVGNYTKKCALLEEITGDKAIHKNSPLYSQALYELARTRIQNVEDEKAEEALEKLLKNPGNTPYYYKALNEMGMINANRKEYNKALEYYKRVVELAPVTEEGQSALAGIENIYQSQNRPDLFLAYLDNIGLSSVKSADERENMLFNSAEQIFLSGNCTEALAALNTFIEKYPQAEKIAQANFYIAECYNKEGKREKAAQYYYKVMETQDGAFSEISTLNYGRLCYSLEKYEEAVNAYETLSQIAQLENNKLEALVGKMKSYFMCRNYEQTIIEAKELLANPKADNSMKRLGNYHLAKSMLATDKREEAIPLLEALSKEKGDAIGAEATYLLIEDAYDTGDFTSVENRTFAFSESGSGESYWLARSFIVLGDSYVEQNNIEQALATFNSIKENYEPSGVNDDIAGLLKTRLDKLSKLNAQ